MTVKTAIEILTTMPPESILRVPSLGHGGNVPLQGFEQYENIVEVEFCEDDEVMRFYGHVKIQ